MEAKLTHLQMIQSIISRMAGNSFLLKGWSVTLVAALFVLAAKDANKSYVVVAYFPAIVFWALDGYFLAQERGFSRLYDHVRELDPSKIDFSMDTRPHQTLWTTWPVPVFSRTLVPFHGVILVTIIIAGIVA